MVWPKIKAWWWRIFSSAPQKLSREQLDQQLSSEVKAELAQLAGKLGAQHVSVREVAADEPIGDAPEIGEQPLPPSK